MKTTKTKAILISSLFVLMLGVAFGMYKLYNPEVMTKDEVIVMQDAPAMDMAKDEMVMASTTLSGTNTNTVKATSTAKIVIADPWKNFTEAMKQKRLKELTKLQFEVTQNGATEDPHTNAYDKNYAKGIYVDIVSGEPLYLSTDKFDSGTGWPSFTKTVSANAVILKEDKSLFSTRTEVVSRIAMSHIGHVFDDGPVEKGGKRYCMNSAALRFVPIANMAQEGYGAYVSLVK